MWVQWFERGKPQEVPRTLLDASFGAAIVRRDAESVSLWYDDLNACEASIHGEAAATMHGVAIRRPCSNPALWAGILALLQAGNGVCYWAGGRPQVSRPETVPHLPPYMVERLGNPQVVASGDEMLARVEAS